MNRILVLALALGTPCFVFAQDAIDDNALERSMAIPLANAGIKLDDDVALIRALQRSAEDPRLATYAAYALGKRPKTDMIVRELDVAAQSDDDILMNYAVRSLLKLGDRQWVSAAAARLRKVKQPLDRVMLAGALARAGRYDGWDIIEAAIVSGEPSPQLQALTELGAFRGMKDSSGKQVNLLEKLDDMMKRAPENRRAPIFQRLNQIGLEDQPPPAPKPKKP